MFFFLVWLYFFLGGCFRVGGDEKYGCLWLFYMVIFLFNILKINHLEIFRC